MAETNVIPFKRAAIPVAVEEHARLSPSSSKRWMACAGSIVLAANLPDPASTYRDDGTAMHTVAKMCLTEHWQASKAIGTKVPVNSPGEHIRVVEFTRPQAELTQGYVDTIRYIAIGNLLRVETRVAYLGDQFGTADAIIVSEYEPGHHELIVIDLKTGFKYVDPEENTQGMCYALGALDLFDLSHNIDKVRIGIYQPAHGGLNEWSTTVEHLREFEAKLKAAAWRVDKATHEYVTGPGLTADWARDWLNPEPNEAECAFCKAMPFCPNAQAVVEDVAGAKFEVMMDAFELIAESPKGTQVMSPLASPTPLGDNERLSALMKSVGFLEDFCLSVRAEVERRALAGEDVPGFGLELGRLGNRKWTDAEKVAEILRKRFRMKVEEVFDFDLKSPTEIEKVAPKVTKDGGLKPHKPGEPEPVLKLSQWHYLQQYIGRAPAVPSVKPVHLIKTPYTVAKPDLSTFDVVEDKEDLT